MLSPGRLHLFASLISAAPVLGKISVSSMLQPSRFCFICRKLTPVFCTLGMRLTASLEGHCLIWWLLKSSHSELGEGVVITQFVVCVISGVFIFIFNKDYLVLGNEHGVKEQEWLLWPYTTVPNNKPDFPLVVSSSLPSGYFS